ncbi:putative autotransporter adhesin-like protein [Maribacter vaceletii]|uniref:Putative autotransporter adhesin-like protein n=1 Tax=Maribacter vaceletii TaxID=1206816 RepID=A0A495DRU3_9FLAO|nr:head GIN domain-containing protein [Maribacter vaceletii]RKR06451.1 putative autotransporter adhesin-like protein [Maribacter vaceletii]
MKKIAILSLSILMCSSCIAQWGKKIKGNGNVTTINRTTTDYDAVSVSGWFDVELVDGTEGEISIKGEENLLEYIITKVKDNKLVIKVEKGVNLKPSSWNDGIVITVPVESISSVALSGSGDIVGKKTIKTSNFETAMSGSGDITLDIDSNNINASMSGSGDINLSGATTNFDATISGSGDIKAFDLIADNVDATISGSADIKVTAKQKLKARVSGSGDINYKGNPTKIDTKVSGSGDITKE